MTDEEMIRRTATINYEILITHGLSDSGVGFEWHGVFIHDPFTDPQYGAYPVDPVEQYGDAYTESIFVTDPKKALALAQRQLREKASEDLNRFCLDRELSGSGIVALVEAACGVRVPNSANPLETLTDEQVGMVWAHVDEKFLATAGMP